MNEIFGSDSESEVGKIKTSTLKLIQTWIHFNSFSNLKENNNGQVDEEQEVQQESEANEESVQGSEAASVNQDENSNPAASPEQSDNESVQGRKINSDEDDDDDEVISRKRQTENDVDVFGEELNDLSDDSDDEKKSENNEDNQLSQPRIEQEEEEVEPEQLINIEMPRVKTDLGKELHFVKLPNFLSVEPRPFDSETYEDDLLEKSETVDEEGQARVRLKVENTIRWKYEKDSEGNLLKQSNAKIVKWSDGR